MLHVHVNTDLSIFPEIKIVNPDDPNVKTLQKKLPGKFHLKAKLINHALSKKQFFCVMYLYLYIIGI